MDLNLNFPTQAYNAQGLLSRILKTDRDTPLMKVLHSQHPELLLNLTLDRAKEHKRED